jgi:hypothetical protein
VRNLVNSAELLTVRKVNIETVYTSEPIIGRSQDREANGRGLQFSTSKTRAGSLKTVPRTGISRTIEGCDRRSSRKGALQEGAEKERRCPSTGRRGDKRLALIQVSIFTKMRVPS